MRPLFDFLRFRHISCLVFFEIMKYNDRCCRRYGYGLHDNCKERKRKNGAFRPVKSTITASMGDIPGAVKMAGVWLIPKDAEKPIDGRTKKGKEAK